MLEAIIGIAAVAILLVAGFWFTRGGGSLPGGIDDPARRELQRFTPLGDPMPPPPGEEPEDRKP